MKLSIIAVKINIAEVCQEPEVNGSPMIGPFELDTLTVATVAMRVVLLTPRNRMTHCTRSREYAAGRDALVDAGGCAEAGAVRADGGIVDIGVPDKIICGVADCVGRLDGGCGWVGVADLRWEVQFHRPVP